MDTVAALHWAMEAIEEGDYDRAREHLEAYREWRNKGGFEPKWISQGQWPRILSGDALFNLIHGSLTIAEAFPRGEVE